MAIKCCYKCPDRWVKDGTTCHSTCERYISEKAIHDAQREKERLERVPPIKSSDFNMLACIHRARKYKK